MALWDGNESSCPCDCGFDIPRGGNLDALTLGSPLTISSGGTSANTAGGARWNLGIFTGKSESVNVSATSPTTINISFGITFASIPNVVVSPQCEAAAAGSYGIFCYVMSISETECTVRLNTNYEGKLTINVQWLAIGNR